MCFEMDEKGNKKGHIPLEFKEYGFCKLLIVRKLYITPPLIEKLVETAMLSEFLTIDAIFLLDTMQQNYSHISEYPRLFGLFVEERFTCFLQLAGTAILCLQVSSLAKHKPGIHFSRKLCRMAEMRNRFSARNNATLADILPSCWDTVVLLPEAIPRLFILYQIKHQNLQNHEYLQRNHFGRKRQHVFHIQGDHSDSQRGSWRNTPQPGRVPRTAALRYCRNL